MTAVLQLVDGPAKGVITYIEHVALVVVATRNPIRYHDYRRIGDTSRYTHHPNCLGCTPTHANTTHPGKEQ